MGTPYSKIDWHNIGSPMTPFVQISFRNAGTFTFPSPTNKVYIESATFDVLNDNGASTASMTLCDPDFINLETVFLSAIVASNRTSKINGYWFCRIYWGWTYYGQEITYGKTSYGQGKYSGVHAYMLKDLRYDLGEADLKVSFDLIDLGESLLSATRNDEPDPVVGDLKIVDVPNAGGGSSDGKDLKSKEEHRKNAKEGMPVPPGSENKENKTNPDDADSNEGSEKKEIPPIDNKFYDRTPWDILQTMLMQWWANSSSSSEKLGVTWDPTIEGTVDGGSQTEENLKKIDHTVSSNQTIKQAIDDLLNLMKLEGYVAVSMAGLRLVVGQDGNSQRTPGICFGWQPKPPTQVMDSASSEVIYRHARTFVYRPGSAGQVARGETLIKSLSYEWTSKGFWQVGLPKLYAVVMKEDGTLETFVTKDQFTGASDGESVLYLGGSDGEIGVETYTLESAVDKLNSTAEAANLSGGYELVWNYDVAGGKEEVDVVGKKLVVNVWNKFSKEMFDVTVTIHGDPWLDNSIWNIYGGEDHRNKDSLVNLFNAYFTIIVYRPSSSDATSYSPLISGNYLCLKGCSHSISEGEYSTTLKLIKAW